MSFVDFIVLADGFVYFEISKRCAILYNFEIIEVCQLCVCRKADKAEVWPLQEAHWSNK
jgi:hypothetical protein